MSGHLVLLRSVHHVQIFMQHGAVSYIILGVTFISHTSFIYYIMVGFGGFLETIFNFFCEGVVHV